MKFAKPRYIPAFLTVALLMGLTAETLSRPRPGNADPYHARVKTAVAKIAVPDGWTFTDGKLPTGAIALLKDPVSLYRRFQAPHRFDFLLIQCRDARDMGGHYPPICYPSSGWVRVINNEAGKTPEEKLGKPMEWIINGRVIIGMEYEFTGSSDTGTITRTVDNLLILPREHDCYVRQMDKIREAAADYLHKFYGAAQIQLIFDGAVPENERREIFTQLIGKNMNLLTVLERSDEPRNAN